MIKCVQRLISVCTFALPTHNLINDACMCTICFLIFLFVHDLRVYEDDSLGQIHATAHLYRITKRRYFMKMKAICFTLDLGYSVCCYFSGATADAHASQNWSHCKHFICFMNMFLQCARIDEIDAIFVWMCDAACYGHLKGNTSTKCNQKR